MKFSYLLFIALISIATASLAGQQVKTYCPKSQDIKIQRIPGSVNSTFFAAVNGVGYAGYDAIFDFAQTSKEASMLPFYEVVINHDANTINCKYQASSGKGAAIMLRAGIWGQRLTNIKPVSKWNNQTCVQPGNPEKCLIYVDISNYESGPILKK